MSAFISSHSASLPETADSQFPNVAAQAGTREHEVLRLDGELDQLSVARVAEQIFTLLAGTADTLLIDLTAVRFLCVNGLRVLAEAADRANELDIQLRVLSGGVCVVERGLRAAGLQHSAADSASDRVHTGTESK